MPEQMPVLKEPKPNKKRGRKLLIVLLLLFAALLAVLFLRSPLSKIESVDVAGQRYIGAEEIRRASGLAAGDSFFYPLSGDIASRITSAIGQIESATIRKHFPGEVSITVKEYPAVAFEVSAKGEITAILANGSSVVGKDSTSFIVDKPVLSGWKENDPLKAQLTKQLAALPAAALSDFSEIMANPSKSYPDRIKIYTRTGFEVITAISMLTDKAEILAKVTASQDPGRITMLSTDWYESYEAIQAKNEAGGPKDSTQPQ